ncbi:MAG: zinc finger protein [Thermococcaceae archaeon]|jgi:zinc finger protein|uniref:ZPR1 zinc finger domain-containing protein n=1 Tax=Thermococcus TaxID=2263 RepID=UPI0005B2D608|nr:MULTISPECIES: ZPR1 zinc finger domain-containing protein [Thermococcus]MDK2784039.1 zinc finger protein [Thermococcaceae archaeon]MCA6214003.1 ZPR1 zinc finger domain-containing protein [Thermococcus bergensis]MDK2854125.1 zinc finger protein [Thermococcaceae archaeon]MDK2984222.1 zinc finger protein [Thermococcaceae archaeon]MDN5321497.1 zinc finger protein [Thermococcaceae archaeon]
MNETNEIHEVKLGDCPICGGKNTLKALNHIHEIPYFGKVMESTIICEKCGYRNADVMVLEEKEPKLYTVKVEEEKDLFTRVVRSKSGTIELEEIGVKIEPGPASQGFVTNVEGVLERTRETLLMARDFKNQENDEESVKKIDELLAYIEDVKEGKKPLTVKIMDPFGNSALIGEKVKSRLLTKEEIKKLSTGPYVVYYPEEGEEKN